MPAEPRREHAEAVAVATALATALDAELLLLGLVGLPALGPMVMPPAPDGIAGGEPPADPLVREQLARTKAKLGPGVRARTLLGWGPDGPAILDAARDQGADLVVVASPHGGGLAHLLHGSTAHYVAEHCGVPVLLVPPRTGGRKLRRFLVAVDGSAAAVAAVDAAAALARGLGGQLTLLAVAPLTVVPAPVAPGPPIVDASVGPEQQELLDRLARERLDELVGRVDDGLDVRSSLSWGPAGPAIVEAAGSGEQDVVAIPWPDRGALGHLLRDHPARHVLQHAQVPVLVVPEPAA